MSEVKQSLEDAAESYIPEGDPMYEYPSYYHERVIEKAFIAGAKWQAARSAAPELLEALKAIMQSEPLPKHLSDQAESAIAKATT